MAAALLLSLAVDIHSRSERKPGTDLSSPTADDFLLPQSKWVDGKLVQLPYYHFTIRFAVSAHFSGSIAVDAEDELTLFRAALTQALATPQTQAQIRLRQLRSNHVWLDNNERSGVLVKTPDPMADERHIELSKELGDEAHHQYTTMRRQLEASGDHPGPWAHNVRHEYLLFALAQKHGLEGFQLIGNTLTAVNNTRACA